MGREEELEKIEDFVPENFLERALSSMRVGGVYEVFARFARFAGFPPCV
jgi:hypothetical protein